ncbi:MAG TPA: L-arabinonate dehydratase [Gammaproteobacteria bacterium]|nr:L-arabinonate dehydratase [Gammaproteobacteria bacterium]
MTERVKTYEQLRSYRWFGAKDLRSFGHRSRAKQMGYDEHDWAGKPIIGIINTWSEINPCHLHFKLRAEAVKRGVWQTGGFPLELPAMTLDETYTKPSSMLYRNFLAMECEELLRSHPIDGAVLMGGCDKTTPALLMGATSMGIPAIFLPAGPMLRGNWHGETLGSGSDTWKYWDEKRAGNISEADWHDIEAGIARSHGHCMTMGTASTMTSAVEALGMTLPGAASIPAADANHERMACHTGRRIVDMVWEDLTPARVQTPQAFENAVITVMALGGSTNAIIHLIAHARRAGCALTLDDFDRLSRRIPVLADIRPSGRYLMEDFYYAGGLPALLSRLGDELHLDALTVNGKTLGENVARARVHNDAVIRPRGNPVAEEGATAVLKGNLAPLGCVMKPAAADPRFLRHAGPALVFDSYAQMKASIDDPHLAVTPDTVLVLRNAGPQGGPGMPEWGMLPIPAKLVREGVRDMLRISDARMSGTSYGACVLHVAPESFVGGALALVQTGDTIAIDVAARALTLEVAEEELARRRARWQPPAPHYRRGYGYLFAQHIRQAHEGCDFDCLETAFGEPVPEPAIY